MKTMLLAASLTGAFIAGLLLMVKGKKQKSTGQAHLSEDGLDGQPVRNMKFTMG